MTWSRASRIIKCLVRTRGLNWKFQAEKATQKYKPRPRCALFTLLILYISIQIQYLKVISWGQTPTHSASAVFRAMLDDIYRSLSNRGTVARRGCCHRNISCHKPQSQGEAAKRESILSLSQRRAEHLSLPKTRTLPKINFYCCDDKVTKALGERLGGKCHISY